MMLTFKSATFKLTLFYVLIAMVVSIAFSIAIYNISAKELENGFNRQARVFRDIPSQSIQDFQTPNLDDLRLQQINESNDHLRHNLTLFNLLILVLSSTAGYFLARRTLKPIEEAMDAQSRFTADASHELRTPITAMRTEIEVSLRDKRLDLISAKKLLESNLEEADKLESLSNALLKLARYQDDIKKTFHKVNISDIVVTAFEKIESLANQKSIEFENELEDVSIQGDKESLTELFVILLDNAIKYSPAKSTVNISVHKTDGHVMIKVKDSGIGIKASDLPHIFDRFYRADHSRNKEKINGYGLGLSIAKNIVDLHSGTISAVSKPGKGSEFILKFRIAK
jgi:signal transduction histidine kinase